MKMVLNIAVLVVCQFVGMAVFPREPIAIGWLNGAIHIIGFSLQSIVELILHIVEFVLVLMA